MSYRIEFGDGPFEVIVTLQGRTGWEELAEIDPAFLSDPRFRDGMNVLYDYSALQPAGAGGSDDVRAMAARDGAPHALERVGRIAVVASHDAVFGIGRMWLAFLDERVAARTTLVRSRAEAYEWIAAAAAAAG